MAVVIISISKNKSFNLFYFLLEIIKFLNLEASYLFYQVLVKRVHVWLYLIKKGYIKINKVASTDCNFRYV